MSDEELMEAVRNGDEAAYRALVRRHLGAVSRYAFRLLGDRHETEDVAQETFLKLWTGASRWRPERARLSTWLHRIAHNLCVDRLRRRARSPLPDEAGDAADGGVDAGPGPGERLDGDRETAALRAAIGRLPESQRTALMLCHYGGFSNKEAAAVMGVSLKALESAVGRARRGLCAMLGGGER